MRASRRRVLGASACVNFCAWLVWEGYRGGDQRRLWFVASTVEVNAMLAVELRTKPLSLQPHVVTTVIDDGAVLFDLETKYFYRLNATGWAMVKMFEDGATVEQVRSQ